MASRLQDWKKESNGNGSSGAHGKSSEAITVGKKLMVAKLRETLNSALLPVDNVDMKSKEELAICIQRARAKRMAHDRARKEKAHNKELESR